MKKIWIDMEREIHHQQLLQHLNNNAGEKDATEEKDDETNCTEVIASIEVVACMKMMHDYVVNLLEQ